VEAYDNERTTVVHPAREQHGAPVAQLHRAKENGLVDHRSADHADEGPEVTIARRPVHVNIGIHAGPL